MLERAQIPDWQRFPRPWSALAEWHWILSSAPSGIVQSPYTLIVMIKVLMLRWSLQEPMNNIRLRAGLFVQLNPTICSKKLAMPILISTRFLGWSTLKKHCCLWMHNRQNKMCCVEPYYFPSHNPNTSWPCQEKTIDKRFCIEMTLLTQLQGCSNSRENLRRFHSLEVVQFPVLRPPPLWLHYTDHWNL